MPAAYVIARLDIHDPETFETYRGQVPATLEPFGGEYIVRGGRQEVLEGTSPEPRTVVLRFPSYEQAKAWHDAEIYEAPRALRQSAALTNMLLVEGI